MTPPTWFAVVSALVLIVPGAIVGSAFAEMVAPTVAERRRSLRDALAMARDATPWRIRLPTRSGRRDSGSETEKVAIVLVAVGPIIAVARYSQHVAEIASALVLFSGAIFVGTMLTFLVFWAKKCVDGRSVAWRVLLSSVLWTTGLFTAFWLENAPRHGAAVGLFRARVEQLGPIGAFFQAPPGEFQQVSNQMVGAFLCLLMLVVFIALCLASISSIFIASRTRPRWFWLALFWLNGWAINLWVWFLAVMTGLAALVLVSGLAFDGGEAFSRWIQESFPTPGATPAG